MNYLPLPLHNKSKTIHFIYSPKLWFQNFISYLETNNNPLYNTIINCVIFIKIFIFGILCLICFYCIGYIILINNSIKDRDRLYKEEHVVTVNLVILSMGVATCFVLLTIFNILHFFIIYIFQFSLQLYNTIIDLIASLRAYNNRDIIEATV